MLLLVTLGKGGHRWENLILAVIVGATWPIWVFIMIAYTIMMLVGELIDYD